MQLIHSELFDGMLVIAGLILVIIGLVMFVRSKSSGDASSVEAFGIKLNVTHPSLILVLAGVGLMLAPRLLPGLPGSPAPQPGVATAPATPEAARETAADNAPAGDEKPAAPKAVPPRTATAPAPAPDAKSAARPAPPATPSRTEPAASVARAPTPRPSPSPTPAAEAPRAAAPTRTESVAARPEPAPAPAPAPPAAPATPTAAPKPARPVVAFASLGLPISRDFWSGETPASYTRRMQSSVRQASQSVLRMTPQSLDLDADAFNRWWNESRDHPVSRAYCDASPAPRALVSARIETPITTSRSESAYWPEFSLRLYHCATHRVYRQQRTLSPANSDEWPFSSDLTADIERFFRTYRADLAE